MRVTSIVTAALLASVAATAPAPAATVSPAGVRFPRLAVNASGATVVAWERFGKGRFGVEVRTGRARGKLGRTQRLAARGLAPRVAIGADGTRAVQWMQNGAGRIQTLRIAVARPGHGFGKGQVVEQCKTGLAPVGVAVQPNGRVVGVWISGSAGDLAYAIAPRGHAFGTARKLPGARALGDDPLVVDPRDGAVILAAVTRPLPNPPTNQQAGPRTLAITADAFSEPVIVSDPAGLGEAFAGAVSGSGGAGVVYTQTAGTRTLNLVRRNADGSWSRPELVDTPPEIEDVFAVDLQATLPADGSALAAWSIDHEASDGMGRLLGAQTVASIAAPSKAFGPAVALTPANEVFGHTAVASAGGEAFVATAKAHGPVLLVTMAAGATTLGAPVALSPTGDGDILLAAGGSHVLAAWQRHDRLVLHTVR
jgi:hypothetical protein